MTHPKWTDKDDQGNYIYDLMQHETYEHGETEQDAEAILIKYFGQTPIRDHGEVDE